MSWLSRFSLAQRALVGLISLVALAFGLIAIPQIKQQLLPTIDLPMVSVIAPYQGASPDVVEKQVVEPIEDNLQGVDGVTGVTSTASEGNAVIMASFDYGNDTDRIVSDVQQAVNRARNQLPDDVDPQVVSGSTDDMPTVVLAVTSDKDQQALADQLDTTVVPALKDIDGVGRVQVTGVRDLQVTVTPQRRGASRGPASPPPSARPPRAGGATVPAGSFDRDGANRTVQVGGGFTSLRQIKDLDGHRRGRGSAGAPGVGGHREGSSRPRPTPSPVPTAGPASPSTSRWTTTAAPSPSRTRSRTSCPACARTSAPVRSSPWSATRPGALQVHQGPDHGGCAPACSSRS